MRTSVSPYSRWYTSIRWSADAITTSTSTTSDADSAVSTRRNSDDRAQRVHGQQQRQHEQRGGDELEEAVAGVVGVGQVDARLDEALPPNR